ncbi:MAG TPA: YhhA family cyclophane-containing RiPP [Nitrospira sp.]|jgi:hypothetical protein|nr:YhhA family cyclophane-containing RiPP [Nitrospira sp.]
MNIESQLEKLDPPEGVDTELSSIAIARLIEEVRSTDFEVTRAYNRTYNRHNR